jgi:hypothetical protein
MQEQGFARECIVICGRFTISFDELVMALLSPELESLTEHVRRVIDARYVVSELRQQLIRTGLERFVLSPSLVPTLESVDVTILDALSELKATEPVDKVHGLYSILRRIGIDLPDPDYGKGLKEVYESAVLSWIRARNNLHILKFATRPTNSHSLPSWLPDWKTDSYSNGCASVVLDGRGHQSFVDTSDRFAACPTPWKDSLLLKYTPGILQLHGKRLGRIGYREHCPVIGGPEAHGSFEEFANTCREWCRHVWSTVSSYPTDESVLMALFKTLTLHEGESMYDREGEEFMSFKSWFVALLYPGWPGEIPDFPLGFSVGGESLSDVLEMGRSTSQADFMAGLRKIHTFVSMRLANYSFFVLDSGYFGTAIYFCQVNDEIFLICGSNCPLILRPKGHQYQFVAPAYLHGVMNSEAWPEDESALQEIELV